MLTRLTDQLNFLFKNDTVRTIIFIITSVWIGYTLQPVPQWVTHTFDKSNVIKFIIMLLVGIVAFYPLDETEVKNIIIGSAVTMALFAYLRTVNPDISYIKY